MVVFSPRVMDEHRAINQAMISDRGGAAACPQMPLASLVEEQGHWQYGGGSGRTSRQQESSQ